MQVNLVFLKKDGSTSSFKLPSNVTSIGRRQDCDFCIPLMIVSRKHCEINLDKGKVTVRDMKSRNSTFINGHRIEEAQAKPGDLLKIGPVEFVFQIDGVPETFESYFPDSTPQEAVAKADSEAEAVEDQHFDEAMEDLSDINLGHSHATELLGNLGDDFEFNDDDFAL